MKLAVIGMSALLLSVAIVGERAQAQDVAELGPIVRELKIAEDVFRSAMVNSVADQLRVTNVTAQYLAGQGVLVSMKVVVPWIDVDDFTQRSIDIGSEVESFRDIPEMVHEILAELDIAVAPYDPDEREELRRLRAEQRALRNSERKLRTKLRETRRKRSRAVDENRDEDLIEDLDDDIADLEEELNELTDEYAAIDKTIDQQYRRLQEQRSIESDRSVSSANLNQAVGETACNYGSTTFKSLQAQQYLTVALAVKEITKYYVFKMEHIRGCGRGEIKPDDLLARSYLYEI